ncbi:unnamed protein product [Protopolystoma xenopodis]|uniref:Uncharacterized protein n=1 Tax=Protopolystoma xenopodis TaxID=117903 RepID=A0A448XHT4_9PLAT|nr:unnamed protein product [Protopolystoma xenopodis]
MARSRWKSQGPVMRTEHSVQRSQRDFTALATAVHSGMTSESLADIQHCGLGACISFDKHDNRERYSKSFRISR